MPLSSFSADSHVVHGKRVSADPPWHALILPLSGFPAQESELAPVRSILRELSVILADGAGTVETFLQFANLHLADGAVRLSSNGRKWMPMMGLGVWPDREPPTCWKMEELLDLGPEDKVRPLMNIVLRIAGDRESRHQARDTMLGLGTVLQLISTRDSDRFLAQAKDMLLPPIQDQSLRGFPFYAPLLEGASLATANAMQIDEWLCGADTMIRESPEDGGVFIVSRFLERALETITATKEWQLRWD